MSWILTPLLLSAAICAVVIVVVVAADRIWDDAFPVFIVGSLIWIVATILLVGVAGGVHYDERACDRYATATERDVRFVRYHYFEWDCLVDTPDGWVTRGNVWSGDR